MLLYAFCINCNDVERVMIIKNEIKCQKTHKLEDLDLMKYR